MNEHRYLLADLASKVGASVIGDERFTVTGLATLQHAQSDQLSFIHSDKYLQQALHTQAGALIVSADLLERLNTLAIEQQIELQVHHFILIDQPYFAFAVFTLLFEDKPKQQGIESTAQIHSTAKIGQNVYIGHHVVIDEHCEVGDGSVILSNSVLGPYVTLGHHCLIESNVTLTGRSQLGHDVRIHANTVIGGEGFGFAPYQGKWHRIAQLGSVRIGNGVRIGSNCSIDRGAVDDTIIEDGVIIDNLVQIAHNVHIGQNTAIAAKSGIAGSSKIGKNCILAGDCGVAGHLTIVDGVTLTAQAVVTKSITQAGTYSSGTGLFEVTQWRKVVARLRQLADLPLTQIAKKVDDMHTKFNESNKGA